MKDAMDLAIKQADITMSLDIGGPFGAAVVDNNGMIIAVASNTVLGDNDPTAHAEINAIRQACKKLGTYDLTGCVLYATGYPCPMCMSAIIWANIKTVYFCNTVEEAEQIGFRDDFIYSFLSNPDNDTLNLIHLPNTGAKHLYAKYKNMDKVIY